MVSVAQAARNLILARAQVVPGVPRATLCVVEDARIRLIEAICAHDPQRTLDSVADAIRDLGPFAALRALAAVTALDRAMQARRAGDGVAFVNAAEIVLRLVDPDPLWDDVEKPNFKVDSQASAK